MVRTHPGLARLPVYGGLLALLVMVVLAAPGVLMLSDEANPGLQLAGALLILVAAWLATFAVVYFNVALAAAADQALSGRSPDIDEARAVARSRRRVVAGWATVSVGMSILLGFIRDRAGSAGGAIAGIGAAVWSLVTFLVVPVLAFEGIGPVAAMKRSAGLFRDRWGQQVTGNVVIGGAAGLVVLLGVLIGGLGLALVVSGSTVAAFGGGVLMAAGVVLAIAAGVFSSAARGVFGVALYHFMTDETAVGPFTVAELESAARTR